LFSKMSPGISMVQFQKITFYWYIPIHNSPWGRL
jgi:hypothetical protein